MPDKPTVGSVPGAFAGSGRRPSLTGRSGDRDWAIPAPRWALRGADAPDTLASRSGAHATNSSRGPVLLIASGDSRRRAAAQHTSAGARLFVAASDVVDFPDRGPSLVIDSGWRPVAGSCLSWMDAHEL